MMAIFTPLRWAVRALDAGGGLLQVEQRAAAGRAGDELGARDAHARGLEDAEGQPAGLRRASRRRSARRRRCRRRAGRPAPRSGPSSGSAPRSRRPVEQHERRVEARRRPAARRAGASRGAASGPAAGARASISGASPRRGAAAATVQRQVDGRLRSPPARPGLDQQAGGRLAAARGQPAASRPLHAARPRGRAGVAGAAGARRASQRAPGRLVAARSQRGRTPGGRERDAAGRRAPPTARSRSTPSISSADPAASPRRARPGFPRAPARPAWASISRRSAFVRRPAPRRAAPRRATGCVAARPGAARRVTSRLARRS